MADELLTYSTKYRVSTSKDRVSSLASRQCGRITRAQLQALGVPRTTVEGWIATGYLIRVLPRVYAVGHAAEDERIRLFSLALFAGPDAAISHGTAAYRRGWLRYRVSSTHVSTPRRIRTRMRGVRFHSGRELDRELVDGVPCTTILQTLFDVAATEPLKLVMRSLAQLDFERRLDVEAVREACGRGRRGSAALLTAVNTYMPQLALTRSDLEDDFLYLLRRFDIPLPEVNVQLHGVEVDCHWPKYGLVVELDGGANHGTGAQRNRDQNRALKLRAHGVPVIRYTHDQLNRRGEMVAADVLAQIEQRRGLS